MDTEYEIYSNNEWLRHRIRAIYWKQWKKVKTKYRKLKELGMDENFIQWHANMRQGIWNCSSNRMVQFALNNTKLREGDDFVKKKHSILRSASSFYTVRK